MRLWNVFVIGLASLSVAALGAGSGSGSITFVGGASESYEVSNFVNKYLTSAERAELSSAQKALLEQAEAVSGKTENLVLLSDTVKMESGKEFSAKNLFQFLKDGTIKVYRNDTAVGCGFYKDSDKGRWVDYRIQTPAGPLHVNAFKPKDENVLLRMGDLVNAEGKIGFWSDEISLQEGSPKQDG